MLPSTLHLLQGTLVRFVAASDRIFQMLILCLYDLICSISMVGEVARSTQLLAGHCLHKFALSSFEYGHHGVVALEQPRRGRR